jgi:hypothetical protein
LGGSRDGARGAGRDTDRGGTGLDADRGSADRNGEPGAAGLTGDRAAGLTGDRAAGLNDPASGPDGGYATGLGDDLAGGVGEDRTGGLTGDRSVTGLNGTRPQALPGDEVGDRPGGRHGRRGTSARRDPEVIQVPRTIRGPVRDDDEHFIPPAPPPLPKLDPVAKGAWAALFGGPGYLVVATAAGWTVSGLAAFLAVAAFIAGFALLVLRMHEPGPGGPSDGDDGAVV